MDQAHADENASIPLDYLESRLEDHFQNVNAIAIAIQNNASGDRNQTVEDLLSFSQNLLQEIHTTMVQRETNGTRSSAWVPPTQASTGGVREFSLTRLDCIFPCFIPNSSRSILHSTCNNTHLYTWVERGTVGVKCLA